MRFGARKGLAFFLTWVLVFQAIYGANTTEAIAEGMQDLGEQIAASLPAGDDDGGDSGDAVVASETDEQDSEPRTAPVDLTADTDALVLGSDGLALAYDKTATDGLTVATSLDAVTLPEKIAGQLSLKVDLDATRQAADAGLTGVLLAGDTFDVALPDGISLAEESAPVALYAADEQGNPTTTQVAEGRLANGKLHVTLAADQQAGASLGATLVAVASLDVAVDSTLVADDASTLTWTLQTPTNANVRTCDLALPGREAVARALNLLTDAPEGGDPDVPGGEDPAQPAEPTTTIAPSTDRSASATPFVTAWADNNNNVDRPSAEELEARREYRLYFQVEGDDTRYPLTTDGRTVSEEAQRLLGMTQDELDAIRKSGPSEYGLEPELVAVDATGNNEYTATSAPGLPSEVVTTTVTPGVDADGKPIQDTQTSSKKITYGICHETAGPEGTKVEDNALIYDSDAGEPTYIVLKDGYFGAQSAPFERECLALVQKQQLTVVLNLGRNSSDVDNLDEWLSTPLAGGTTLADRLHVDVMKNGQRDQSYSGDGLTQLFHWAGATFTQQGGSSGTTYLLSMYAPIFTQDQESLEFRLRMDEIENSNTGGYRDYYQVWYSNEGIAGGSAEASAGLNGGTMTVTRAGNTSFNATKVWLDDDPSARPSTTYTLWRYSDKQGQSSLTASQVQADNGDFVSVTMTAEQNADLGVAQMGGVNGDVPQNNATVDIAERLEAAADNMKLPKYDQDGYPYIYFVRETMDGGDYQQIAGTVGQDGSVDAGSDAAPGYWNPDRSNREGAQESATTRPTGDTPIYDGGTVTNVRSKITQQKVTKTWDAAGFQDQLSDVTVTLKCQRILKRHVHESEPGSGVWELNYDPMYDEDGNWIGTYEWTDFEAAPGETSTVQELTGWSAENLSQTLTGNYDAYDAHGEEYVYRWVETNVEKGDQFVFYIASDDEMSGFFSLDLTNEDGEDEGVTFVSTNDPKTGVITNRYANTTDRHVDKYWAKVDADGDVEYDENNDIIYTQDEKPYDNREVGPVTVRLVRDGELIGKYQLDGKVDDEATDLMNPDGSAMMGDEVDFWDMIVSKPSTVQETSPWHLDFSNLPEFSPEGHRYTYQVLEDDTPGFSSTHEYDQEKKTTKIYNRPEDSGDSSIIRVAKDWKDGGNNSARVPVSVGIYAKRDIYSSDGRLVYNADQQITSVDLSTANDWYAEAVIGVGGLTQRDIYLCELSTDDTADPTEPVPAGMTRMLTKQKCTELATDGIAEYEALLHSWTGTNDRMLTSGYAYEVSYGWSDVLNANVVQNRRVGLQQINIFKDWEDTGATAGERPSANFTITNDEGKVTFVYGGSGEVSAHIDGMGNLPLVGEESVTRNDAEDPSDVDGAFAQTPIVIGKNASVSEDGHDLSLQVSRETGTTQSYYIVQNLPKYDADGNVLHWTVTEQWTSDSGDYVSRQTGRDDSFESEGSAWHHFDYSSFSFENTRSATKTVRFNTRWYDHYVQDNLDQRLDIYLTLYRRVYQYDEQGKPVLDDAGNPTYTVEAVPGYQHYDWNPMSDEGADPLYNQYVEVSNLPKYDEHGGEIVYYATVNHSQADATVKNLNYADSWFTYDASENARKNNGYPGSATWDSANESDLFKAGSPDYVDISGITPGSETSNALREDGTFNFRLEQTMSAEGGKVWANLPAGFETADLPDITFYLQRRVEGGHYDESGSWVSGGNDWGELDVTPGEAKGSYAVASYDSSGTPNYDVADGKTAVAWTSDLSPVRGNRYAFVMNTYGNNTSGQEGGVSLPVYDRYGRVYEYRIREIIDGLIQKEADGSDAPGGYDVSDAIASGKTPEDAAGKIYNVTYGSWRSFMVGNVYNASKKGNLTVKKLFSNLEPGDRVPNCTFALYRYYVKADGTKSVAQLVGTKTLDNSNVRANADGQLERTIDFTDLDVYTPAGTYWVYLVGEQPLDGYVTAVRTGDLDRDSSELKYFWQGAGSLADGSACSDSLDDPAVKDPSTASFYQPKGTVLANDHTPDVTFENTYTGDKEDLGSLAGVKRWYDQDNIAGIRPDHVELEVTRRYADGQLDATNNGVVALQSDNPDGPAYLAWNYNEGTNSWSYSITNLERIAPNGTYWKYEVREKNVDGSYNVGINGGSADMANFDTDSKAPLTVGAIENYLKTKVGFTKVWADDASDVWAQRPVAYFTLQARVSTGEDSWSDWADAGATFNTYLGTNLQQVTPYQDYSSPQAYKLPNGLNTVDRVSRADSNTQRFTTVWRDLPVTASVGEGEAAQTYQIEYRVVESRLVYDKYGNQQVIDLSNPTDDGTYSGVTGSYQPSQSTSSSPKTDGEYVMSTITNRLVSSTKVRVTKTWEDEMNAWATRPGTSAKGDAWTSTFVLQRRTAGGEWSWLTSFGATIQSPFNDDGSLNGNLRTVTIGDASSYPVIQKSAEFSSLPGTDPNGLAYEYRVAELVQGSYEAKDPTSEAGAEVLATNASGTQSLVAVSSRSLTSGEGFEQVFNNVLKTTSLTGTKTWNDWGTGLASNLDPENCGIKLNLQRSVDGGKTWQTAKRGDGTDVTPSWTKNADGTWTYTFEKLPLADQQGRAYTYRAVEQDGSVPGFFSDKSASSDGAGTATDGTINNVATRFTFDKVGDGTTGSSAAAGSLNGVAFSVRDANGHEVATWSRAEDGTVNSTVGGVAQMGANAGYITGLAAGTYTVVETTTPAGYVSANNVQLTIGVDGSVSVRGAGAAVVSGDDQAVAPERGNAVVRVTNQVFRAQVALNKFYNHGNEQAPVPSMTFELYLKGADGGADTLVATGITTDASGSWTSQGSQIAVETVGGASVLGSFYQTLADGLPQGTYYLRETGSSPLTQTTSDARYEFTVGASDNAQTVTVNAENAEFNASAHLAKVDSETGAAVDGARFELFYTPAGVDATAERSLGTFETGKSYALNATGTGVASSTATAGSGTLAFSGLKKGSYRLVENANTGYALDANNAPTATWTVDNNVQGTDFDLATNSSVTWANATVANGALVNTPLHGSLTMKKTDANGQGLPDATFSLQRKGNDGTWVDAQSVTSGEDGTITVADLPWGTYRFVETTPAPGYVGKGATTSDVTIDRNNVAASISTPRDLGVIANNQTTFTIKKYSWDGVEALAGAKYTVTPAAGSAFVDGASEKHLTTDADGVAQPDAASDALAGNVVAGNSYVVTETQAPAGFVTPDPASVTVSVGDDGSLAIEGDASDAWSIDGIGLASALTVRDKAIDLRLQKVDENGDPIAGSEFTLSGVFAGGQDTRTISPDATSESSVFPNDMLEGQTYTLHESQPPVGYSCVADLTFRVAHASDGSVRYEVVGELPSGWSISEDGVTATATDKLVDFNIAKTDLNGNPLKNARFEIEGLFVDGTGSVSEATYEGTTNESGLIDSVDCIAEGTRATVNGAERVADGVYEIRETDAPYGYELEGTSAKVKIARDGSVTLLDGASSAWSLGAVDDIPTLTLADTPVSLTFSKLAADSEESLDGALFTIEGVFATGDGDLANAGASQKLEDQTVDDLSELKFVAGKSYTLTETKAPAGYELIQGSVSFTVGTDGTIQSLTTNHVSNGSFSYDHDHLTLVARDIPIRLAITKRSEDGRALYGGHFTLTPQAGSTFADGSTEALELVTDVDGVAHLAGEVGNESLSAKLVANNAYKLRETVSPAGFKLIEGSWAFKVNADGTITPGNSLVKNGTIELAASGDSLAVTDEVIPFGIVKYGERDEDGNAPLLAGAVFEVAPHEGSAFADPAALEAAGILEEGSARITTGIDGRAGSELVDQLVVGNRYEIREVVAPAGYTLLPEALTVTVEPDGRLSCGAADRAEGFEVRSDGTIEVFEGNVVDEATQFAVRKVDAEDALLGLDGATFSLTPADGFTFADGSEEAREVSTETVSGEAGLAVFDRALLRADNESVYELRETRAPDGYALSDAVLLFRVDTSGFVVPVRAGDDGYVDLTEDELAGRGFALDESGVLVVAADKPVDVTLRKAGEDGEPLAGATFTLSCADGTNDEGEENHFANGSTTDVLELEPDADGTLLSRQLVVGNSYELEETQAPEGHAIVEGRVRIYVNADGTVQITGVVQDGGEGGSDVLVDVSNDWSVSEDGHEIVLADPATHLRIAKRASDGAAASAMAGARFEVSGLFAGAAESSSRVVTIGADGTAPELAGLLQVGERYVIREVAAPSGYLPLTSTFEVAVRQDGSIVSCGDVAGWDIAKGDDGIWTVTATDDPVPPVPATPGSDEPGKTSKVMPQTGDETPTVAMSLIAAAGLALLALGLDRRRRRA